MNRHVLTYSSWTSINENREFNEKRLSSLKRLVDLGVITPEKAKQTARNIRGSIAASEDPIYSEILDSPEYQEFKELGLEMVSSTTQLKNGTLVIGYPGYTSANQFALGFYTGGKILKRLTPKRIEMGVRGRTPYGVGSMDFRIKDFSKKLPPNSSDVDFYLTAMRWALDNIDFTSTSHYSGTPNFPVKGRQSSY